MSSWQNGSHGVNSNPAPQIDPRVNVTHAMDVQIIHANDVMDWTNVPMPKTGIVTHIVSIVGALLTTGGVIGVLLNRSLGIWSLIGFFLILISSILYSRSNRTRLNIVRAYCERGWKEERTFRAPFGKVLRYSFFSLLPLYCAWCLPVILGLFVGYIGWMLLGVPILIVSILVLINFSYTWRDLEIKRWKYWGIQILIYAIINGMGRGI